MRRNWLPRIDHGEEEVRGGAKRQNLRGELLGAQAVSCHNFHGQVASVREAERVQHDLADHGVVGNHHGDGTK